MSGPASGPGAGATTATAPRDLAADLGHLASPGLRTPFDDVRLALLDAIVTAKGPDGPPHASWQAAFDHAARSIRVRILEQAETELRGAAARSRYPARRLARLLPDAVAADALLHRLLAEGMPLEQLASLPLEPVAQRRRAVALATAWEGAVRVAAGELARWRAEADSVATWRRPAAALWVASGILFLLALLCAAWLGGQLPAPAWFAPIGRWWWSLPWP